MNKYAADKISQEYYTLGQQLALDNFSKTAGLPKEVIKKMVQAPVAGLSGLAGYATLQELAGLYKANPHPDLLSPQALALISALGGGAMLGAKGAGKAVDLAHSGGATLLNKLRP